MKKNLIGILILSLILVGGAFAQELGETEEPALADGDDLPKWSASGAIGFAMTTGNSETLTATGGLEGSRLGNWTNHFARGWINYGAVKYPEAEDYQINTNNFGMGYRFEGYYMADKKPYFWVSGTAESDQFQGFWQRYTIDGGPGYSFFGKSQYVLKLEAGYLFSLTRWIDKVNINPDFSRSDIDFAGDPDIKQDDLHVWEPTHNGLARLIASVPVKDWLLLTEEALATMNFRNSSDYRFVSSTGAIFKLTSQLSFSSNLKVTYVNQPGLVDDLDETGTVHTDATGAGLLERADNTDTTWTNSLVISFF